MATSLRVLPGFKGGTTWWPEGLTRKRGQPGGYDAYTECLAHFIRGVRKDLQAPDMKFVIGVMGVGGPWKSTPVHATLPFTEVFGSDGGATSMPEFKGNAAAVRTAPFLGHALEGT